MDGMRGQGATEYLVLLAVVLIVALVSVALLGFFPGMASDAQMTQSKTYWSSASPIAITSVGGRYIASNGGTYAYLTIKNNGAYPIRLTKIIGGDGVGITIFYADAAAGCTPLSSGNFNLSDYYYMASGDEMLFATPGIHGAIACRRHIGFTTTGGGAYTVGGAATVCQNSSASPGMINFKTFGFEYIEYLDNNQQITKREIGAKPLIAKCTEPY